MKKKKNHLDKQKKTIWKHWILKDPTKLTESSQPCLAACRVEPAQLQNWTETEIKVLLDTDVDSVYL